MRVKLFDCESELDLESDINNFIIDKEIVDIKYQVAISMYANEQIYCFSAMVIYK